MKKKKIKKYEENLYNKAYVDIAESFFELHPKIKKQFKEWFDVQYCRGGY